MGSHNPEFVYIAVGVRVKIAQCRKGFKAQFCHLIMMCLWWTVRLYEPQFTHLWDRYLALRATEKIQIVCLILSLIPANTTKTFRPSVQPKVASDPAWQEENLKAEEEERAQGRSCVRPERFRTVLSSLRN